MQNRTDLLNYLIERYGLKSYLEIGVQGRVNFDKIKCGDKLGIDPEFEKTDGSNPGYTLLKCTSDSFFETNSHYNNLPFDLIFIDGLHHAEQVKKDFENALKCLSDKGFIVLHDCLPEIEEMATHERKTKQWYGTVWQFAMTLPGRDGISYFTWNNDCGCCVIWKDKNATGVPLFCGSTWDEYLQFRDMCLNVTENPALLLP